MAESKGLSNDAKRLLAQIAGGTIGGLAGGQEGFIGGVEGATGAINTSIAEAQKQAALDENKRLTDINTQLNLLDTPGLSLDAREQITQNIARETGLDPASFRIASQKALQASDLLTIIGDADIPGGARQQAWSAFAVEFGLDPNIPFDGISHAFQDLSSEEKQAVFEELQDPKSITDINRVAHFIGNFNGEGEPITGPQLKALGLVTESGLSLPQRMALDSHRQKLKSLITQRDMFGLARAYLEAQSILGRPTVPLEELESNSVLLGQSLFMMMEKFSEEMGVRADDLSGSQQTVPQPGPTSMRNLKRLHQDILDGAFNSPEDAINKLTELGQDVTKIERDLIDKWFRDKSEQNAAESQE